ncbi:hypothetical protein BDR04DRAFT_1145685 [Suillus decipiens]|nr:hypothetical protein BDR04DRAFT_1145685 [Suillus decipiens]
MSYVSEVADLQISKYANSKCLLIIREEDGASDYVVTSVGGLAILVFDYCITFQDEVKNMICTLDLVQAVGLWIDCICCTARQWSGKHAEEKFLMCPPSTAENIIHILSIIAAEGLLVIRTWAFWKKSKKLLIGLLTYSAATVISAISMNILPDHLISMGVSVIPGICNFESSRNAALVYAILALFECVILILTAYKWFHDYRDSEIQSSIVTTVYGGSMLYMSCIIAITVTNVIIDAVFPVGFTNMFDTLQIVIHSVLASRILFHLRSSDSHVYETDIPMVSALRYGQPSQT